MTFSPTDIAEILTEIRPALEGGWIQKIHQPAHETVVLEIRAPGRTHRLLISCQQETTRLHLIKQPLPNPPTPLAFCQYLRAHVQGARIDALSQIPGDRIVIIRLTSKNGPRELFAQLTGKQANLFLLDEQGEILRQLCQDRKLLSSAQPEPPRKRQARASQQTRHFAPLAGHPFPLSAAVEEAYRTGETASALEQARATRSRTIKKQLKKDERRIEAWRDDLKKASTYLHYARYGELLKANLGTIRKGLDQIVLIDYFDDAMPEVTIPLDPTKSAQGNMDDYFRKHRKYLAAERELRPRIAEAERELSRLRDELHAIQSGTWTAPVPSQSGNSERVPMSRRQETGETRRGPFRRFFSTDGLPIFVGRNARENDALTFALAKSDDLWLHARGTPGSHVVVRLEKGKEPPLETLKDAATLALLYSDLKKSGKGEVIYTRRKWVKKAKGQAPGAVIVTQERSLHISLDKVRLAGLKSRSDR